MNDAHLHLATNHLPIILPLVAFFVMIGGFMVKSELLKRTSYIIYLSAVIFAIAASVTGESAEEMVEEMKGVSHDRIHDHEENAEILSLFIYIVGGISVLGLWAGFKKKPFSDVVAMIALAFSLAVFYYAGKTATSGGEIMHKEIRPST
jgi:uncharacterized membrane protein